MAAYYLALLVGGGALQHRLQLATRLAAVDEVDGHGREQPAGGERLADRRALAYAYGSGLDAVAHRNVGHDFAGDAQ